MEITKEEAIKNLNLYYNLTDEGKDALIQTYIDGTRENIRGTELEEEFDDITDDEIKIRVKQELEELKVLLEE